MDHQVLVDALTLIDARYRRNFLVFIESGDADAEFMAYLELSENAQRACGMVLDANIEMMEIMRIAFGEVH